MYGAGWKLMQTAKNLPSFPYPLKNLIKNDPFVLKPRTLQGNFLFPKDPFRIHFTKEHNNIYNLLKRDYCLNKKNSGGYVTTSVRQIYNYVMN